VFSLFKPKLKKILTWTLAVIICGNFFLLTPPIQKVKADTDWQFDKTTKKLTKESSTYGAFKNTTTMSFRGMEKATGEQEFVFQSDQDPNIYTAVAISAITGTYIDLVWDGNTGGSWAQVGVANQMIGGLNTLTDTNVLFPPKYYVINPKCVDEKGNPVPGLTVEARLPGSGPDMADGKGPTDAAGNTSFDATSPPNYYWPDPSVQDFELIALDDSSESGTKNSNGKYWRGQLNLNTGNDFKQGTASDRYIANKDIVIVIKETDTPPKELTKSITEQVVQTVFGDGKCEAEFECGITSKGIFASTICKAQCVVIDFISGIIGWTIETVLYPALGLST